MAGEPVTVRGMNPIESDRHIEPYTIWNVGVLVSEPEGTTDAQAEEAFDLIDEALTGIHEDLALAGLAYGLVTDEPWAGTTSDRFRFAGATHTFALSVAVRVGVPADDDAGDVYVARNAERVDGIRVLADMLHAVVEAVDHPALNARDTVMHVEADLAETRYEQMRDAVSDAYGTVIARVEGAIMHLRDVADGWDGQLSRPPSLHLSLDRTGARPVVHGVTLHRVGYTSKDEYVVVEFGRYLPAAPLPAGPSRLPADGRILNRNLSLPYPRVALVDDDQWACEISVYGQTRHLVVGELDEVIAETVEALMGMVDR